MRRRFVGAGLIGVAMLCATNAVRGQDAAAGHGGKKPQVMSHDTDPDWEVATVRPNASGATNNRIHISGRHVTLENETVARMMLIGYGVQKDQVAGLPDWAKTTGWDIDGVTNVAGVPDLRQFQTMVRNIIEERFGLVLHHEQRVMEVFALRVAKGGPKLSAATGGADAFPDRVDRRSAGELASTFKNTSMHDFVLMALGAMDRPVVDETGLTGKYDFQLTWNDDDSIAPADGSGAPGLFTAVQEQLGLKLEPTKAPADVLVVDKVEKPGAN
jgi:uncharacterized protein (TIGR03435 family)